MVGGADAGSGVVGIDGLELGVDVKNNGGEQSGNGRGGRPYWHTAATRKQIADEYQAGASAGSLSGVHQMSESGIRAVIVRQGVTLRPRGGWNRGGKMPPR